MTTHNIGPIKKIIDLNEDSSTYTILYSVETKNNKPFEASIVTDNELDDLGELKLQKHNSRFQGQTSSSDHNKHTSLYLVLRADENCECVVNIDKGEHSTDTNEEEYTDRHSDRHTDRHTDRHMGGHHIEYHIEEESGGGNRFMIWVLIVVLAIITGYIYKNRNRK